VAAANWGDTVCAGLCCFEGNRSVVQVSGHGVSPGTLHFNPACAGSAGGMLGRGILIRESGSALDAEHLQADTVIVYIYEGGIDRARRADTDLYGKRITYVFVGRSGRDIDISGRCLALRKKVGAYDHEQHHRDDSQALANKC
jgi:hypothetical protein